MRLIASGQFHVFLSSFFFVSCFSKYVVTHSVQALLVVSLFSCFPKPRIHSILHFPMPSFQVDRGRLQRALSQNFYVPFPYVSSHRIYLIGSTGNLYTITFGPEIMQCNCPDQNPLCKHILFLLLELGHDVKIGLLDVDALYIRDTFHLKDWKYVDDFTTPLIAVLEKSCLFCTSFRESIAKEEDITLCNICTAVFHSRHFNEGFPLEEQCPYCHREWNPLLAVRSGNYYNFQSFVNRFVSHPLPENDGNNPDNEALCKVVPCFEWEQDKNIDIRGL